MVFFLCLTIVQFSEPTVVGLLGSRRGAFSYLYFYAQVQPSGSGKILIQFSISGFVFLGRILFHGFVCVCVCVVFFYFVFCFSLSASQESVLVVCCLVGNSSGFLLYVTKGREERRRHTRICLVFQEQWQSEEKSKQMVSYKSLGMRLRDWIWKS